jgi:phosphatidylglycerophosphate synthase
MNTLRWAALAIGVVIFAITLRFVHFDEAASMVRRLGLALPVALFFSALWHLARTWAWAWCFPEPRAVSFAKLARVRLAAEAFSYLTLRGIAGEPLKIVLLADRVDPRLSTAAVALERLAFMIGTVLIVGVTSVVAMATLPLSHGWFRVFRAFAITGGAVAVLSAIVITGRGTYLHSLLQRVDTLLGSGVAQGRAGRFLSAVERLMLELVRHHPKRLVVLTVATLSSYVCMVLEAWVVLRAAGSSISFGGAFAIETVSRVAAFASSPIPANLGALEASSLAAAAAVGASGGAALAVARRIRGLFWAGLGLLIYPRQSVSTRRDSGTAGPANRPPRTVLYLPSAPDVAVPPSARLAGLPIAERVIRAASRAGYERIVVFGSPGERLGALPRDLRIEMAATAAEWRSAVERHPDAALTVVGPGTVTSPALLQGAWTLAPHATEVIDVPAGPEWRESGVLRVGRAVALDIARLQRELAGRRARTVSLPSGDDVSHGRGRLALRITTAGELAAAEQTIRQSSFKDTDIGFARFNRRISLPISIVLMRTPLTANQLSVILVAIGMYSAWLFSLGYYWTGVLGAFLSLAASILDGCDGEIARLKYQESALGCWIETVGDYSYYVAIFVGLTIGAARQIGVAAYWVGGAALGGTVLTLALLIYLRSRITAGRPERLHAIARDRFQAQSRWWTRLLWQVSFVPTRAFMPYGILAFALFNALPVALVLIAVGANTYWLALIARFGDLTKAPPAATFVSAPESPAQR